MLPMRNHHQQGLSSMGHQLAEATEHLDRGDRWLIDEARQSAFDWLMQEAGSG